jgi:hypothetical protein
MLEIIGRYDGVDYFIKGGETNRSQPCVKI